MITLLSTVFTGIGAMIFSEKSLTADPLAKSKKSFYSIKMRDIDGKVIDLEAYRDKKIMIVNVASKCGFTNQYADLQELYESHNAKLEIIGVPCNDFGKQEPGTLTEIKHFLVKNYGVSFLITEKQKIKSSPVSDLYQWLSDPNLNGWNSTLPSWNFCKYIINEDGELTHFFRSGVNPNSEEIKNILANRKAWLQ